MPPPRWRAWSPRAAGRPRGVAPRRRGHHVRRHHPGGHHRAGGAGAPRLRGAGLPRDGHRRTQHGEPVEAGFVTGVLDLTTTELADDLVGGVLSAGPHRLEAAGRQGVPQVVSLGALDMVNFGSRESVPDAVRRPEPLRAQPERHADADDAGGVRGARPAAGRQAVGRDRPGRAVRARCGASRRSPSRAAPSSTPTPTRRCSPGCARRSPRRSRCTRSTRT